MEGPANFKAFHYGDPEPSAAKISLSIEIIHQDVLFY